jgi:two-component system response regulator FixJ
MNVEKMPFRRQEGEHGANQSMVYGEGLGIHPEKGLVHVIDGESTARCSLYFLLRKAGYRIERWRDGETFLKNADKSGDACVLLDIRLPGMDGIEVNSQMMSTGFDFPVIMSSGDCDIELAVRVMKAGAVDFLQKPFEPDMLLRAIAAAFAGIAGREARLERAEWARTQLGRLTEREVEVLDGLACGYPNKTIALDLGISPRTVEVHRASAMSKLNVGNFADALRIAFAAGLGSENHWFEMHDLDVKRGRH